VRVLTVSQVSGYLSELLESDLVLADLWVSGEVSGPRTQPSGHTYFVLKDAHAQLRCVLFRSAQQRAQGRAMAVALGQGAQVIVHGRLGLYEARGDLQLVVDFVQPEGVGLRHAQFERLKAALEEEGLFDAARKRPLPSFPRRIGVVTSPAGAVFHDIANVLRRRWPLAELVLAPTPVQGPEAAPGIVAGLEALNARGDIDVILVARGGGSVEELWAFNEEPVARAVFASLVPVVSAVGHETDYTISDYVADVRAPTPSAAAELVVPDRTEVGARVSAMALAALRATLSAFDSRRNALTAGLDRAERALPRPEAVRQRLDDLERRAGASFREAFAGRRVGLRGLSGRLAALDPAATLRRGYAVVHKGGRVVSSVAQVSDGDPLVVRVADGGFPAVAGAAGPRRRAGRADGRRPAREPGVQTALFP
jgi:exodeoxyribonuclease VII large subunit